MRSLVGVAAVMILFLMVLVSLDRYTRRLHEFSTVDSALGDGVRVALSVSGYWRTNDDGSEEHDGRYSIAIRVWGTGTDVEVASLRIMNPITGDAQEPSDWGDPVRDPSDGAVLLFHRPGVPLSFSNQDVDGELIVRRGERLSRYAFHGSLVYSYREERRSRFWAILMSV